MTAPTLLPVPFESPIEREGRALLARRMREIGCEQVLYHQGNRLQVAVDPDLGVRIRIYDASNERVLADIATTAVRAMNLSVLFATAACRADPALLAALGAAEPEAP